MMHVVRGTTILDPDAVGTSNTTIYRSFAAICKTAKYRIVGRSVVIVIVVIISICDVGICTLLIAISIAITFIIVIRLLGLLTSCLLRDIFFGDSFVAIGFVVVDETAMFARGIYLLGRFGLPMASEISLGGVGIIST